MGELFMEELECNGFLSTIENGRPEAYAVIEGSSSYPGIYGNVLFYSIYGGTLLLADIMGLPASTGNCITDIFGFHIHEGDTCTGTTKDPFAAAGTHFNPQNCEHPQHAGDLPPLFGNHGYAWMMVFTDRFQPQEVVGRTVIIHDRPDDFTTQPAGNAGEKIACGRIESEG